MTENEQSVREILKGLEGLEMLSQWELSMARDLRSKAESLLKSVCQNPPPPRCNGDEPA
jgi:hypothetical protein